MSKSSRNIARFAGHLLACRLAAGKGRHAAVDTASPSALRLSEIVKGAPAAANISRATGTIGVAISLQLLLACWLRRPICERGRHAAEVRPGRATRRGRGRARARARRAVRCVRPASDSANYGRIPNDLQPGPLQCDSVVGGNGTHTHSPCTGSTDAHRSAARAADRAIFSVSHPGFSKKNRV